MAKYFSAFIPIYIIYTCMDPAQLLHVVVKQVGKLYLDLLAMVTNPKTGFRLMRGIFQY